MTLVRSHAQDSRLTTHDFIDRIRVQNSREGPYNGSMGVRPRVRPIAVIGSEQRVGEVDHVFEPEWLVMQLSAELGQLPGDALVERVVGRDDGDGRVPVELSLPQPVE